MRRNDRPEAAAAISSIISTLEEFDEDTRGRIFNAVRGYFTSDQSAATFKPSSNILSADGPSYQSAPKDRATTPKVFLMEKQPRTDVERIACLAYYLSHYRDTPQFKTLDLGKLNTEAAQPKFSNAANAANNAQKMGYLVPGTKGQRQLSGAGEQFVSALPDRAAARDAMNNALLRRKTKKTR